MPLQRGEVVAYDFDRMIVEFTMLNDSVVIPCAISWPRRWTASKASAT